jgi:hypothetical protein
MGTHASSRADAGGFRFGEEHASNKRGRHRRRPLPLL